MTTRLRDRIAQNEAQKRYAAAFDHFATEAQVMRAEGRVAEAEGAAQYANWLLRAWEAEVKDPEPKDLS